MMKFSWRKRPSGFAFTAFCIRGPNPNRVLEAAEKIHAHAEIDDHEIGVVAQVDGYAFYLSRHRAPPLERQDTNF